MTIFEVGPEHFLLDGEPYTVLSGSMNYFRVVPEQWRDRLAWAAHLGLNTVETYLPWGMHEPEPGQWRFDGGLDVESYFTAIAEAGLHALARPGPYSCAEIDFGGLPYWLLREPMRLRSSDPVYLGHVERWLDQVLPRLAPLQCHLGGPILAMQVENEFGAHGHDDPEYLDWLVRAFRARGVEVPLITSDQPEEAMTRRGGHPGALRTANFDIEPAAAFAALRRHQPTGPLMCTEFWNGWFDHWGERHHRRSAESAAGVLDWMLGAGASVNLYMFCGGTNFGFDNGANHDDRYLPTITSYDYDAPLSEDGRPTAKFEAYREVIARHFGATDRPRPELPARMGEYEVRFDTAAEWQAVRSALAEPVTSDGPLTMEELGQARGFLSYEFTVAEPGTRRVEVPGVRDRAQVLVNGVECGVLEREHGTTALDVVIEHPDTTVELVVENLGRVNYGPHLRDPKGIIGDVLVDGVAVAELTAYPMRWETPPEVDLGALPELAGRGPVLYRAEFTVDTPGDVFVDLSGWTKGVVWINGFALGRYWDRGPQRRLYLPGPLLRTGANDLAVLELHGTSEPVLRLADAPDLGD